MIGAAVVSFLKQEEISVTRIIRPESKGHFAEDTLIWDPPTGEIETERLEDHDGVIHLAGANISAQRWSEKYKNKILESRVESTELLSDTLRKLHQPPRVLLTASAVGFYGNHAPEEKVDEAGVAGTDFLAGVCTAWEKAAAPVGHMGIRVVPLRFGVVLGKNGGALAKMLPVFKMGLGGILGDGRQVMSWIALAEIPRIILHVIESNLIGPVNCVSPQAVSNREFTEVLGKMFNRPTVFPVPGIAVKWLFGEMGETLLLGGARVLPRRLLETGYKFQYPDLASALKAALV